MRKNPFKICNLCMWLLAKILRTKALKFWRCGVRSLWIVTVMATVHFSLFSREENEESERRTENRKINCNADSSLDLSVNEHSSSDTKTDSESSDDETDNNVNMQVLD